MDKCKIFHAEHQGVHVLRYVGEIRYPIAPTLGRFFDDLFAAAPIAGIAVDLSEVSSIDSTNLGLLARTANRLQTTFGIRLTVVCDSEDINEMLITMALDKVFDIVTHGQTLPREGRVLTMERADREQVAQAVLEAHQTLMALSEKNRELFRDVVTCFER